jgi:hypothetical protein
MSDAPRWVVVVLILVLAIGLLAFARGRLHHRGDEVGALDRAPAALRVVEGQGGTR